MADARESFGARDSVPAQGIVCPAFAKSGSDVCLFFVIDTFTTIAPMRRSRSRSDAHIQSPRAP